MRTIVNNRFFLIFCAILFIAYISFIANKIPMGYFVASGDYYQGIFLKNNISSYFYSWIDISGQGGFNPLVVALPYYLIQYFLQLLGFDYSLIANGLIFFFIFSSFVSFFYSLRILSDYLKIQSTEWILVLTSLFYAINPHTFQLFTYSYGYLHHTLFYIFLPLLLVFPLKIIQSEAIKNYLLYAIFFTIALVSFNNIAFLVILVFFQILLYGLMYIFDRTISPVVVFKILLLQFFLSLVVIVPFFATMYEVSEKIKFTQVFGGDAMNIIKITSAKSLKIFSYFFPIAGFPNTNLFSGKFFTSVLPLLFFLPSIAVMFLVQRIKMLKQKENILIFVYPVLIIYLVVFILSVRMAPPFESFTEFFFKLPGAYLFRSPDKIYMYFQFFTSILMFFFLLTLRKKIIKVSVFICFFAIVIPFINGGIVEYLIPGYKKNGINSEASDYHMAVKIPDQYIDAANIINKDTSMYSIISLPYSVVSSLNWSNYPKWNFVGQDVISLLFNNSYISANTYDHPHLETELSFYEFNHNKSDLHVLIESIQKFGGKYIIYHNDIDKNWIEASLHTKQSLDLLAQMGVLAVVNRNEYFDVYQLRDTYIKPFITLSNMGTVKFEKISPVKYHGFANIKNDADLALLQSFNSQWKLFLLNSPSDNWCDAKKYYSVYNTTECKKANRPFAFSDLIRVPFFASFDDTHGLYGTFANVWHLEKDALLQDEFSKKIKHNDDGSIDIEFIVYFVPQTYVYYGMISILVVLSFLSFMYVKKHKIFTRSTK